MKTRLMSGSRIILILGLIAIALAASPASAQDALPRKETLYVAGFQWSAPTTFNPLNASGGWPAGGIGNNHQQIFETLFAFNVLTGNIDPLLGKEVKFTDASTAVVTMQDGTKWQDGKPLTTADVIFSYELAKKHKDINYTTFWDYVTEIKATGDRTVQFTLNKERLNPGLFRHFLSIVRILPKHIWEERSKANESIGQVVDMQPVGSGPYKLKSSTIQSVVIERDDNYWGKAVFGTPAPKYIVHPIFKSNDEGNLALQRGEIDVSQQFTPQIWQMWEQRKLPVGTWFKEEPYYLPGNIPVLHINQSKKGLDNVLVRRALAFAINYPQIAATAMSRYSAPAKSSLIIPSGGEGKFFNADLVAKNGWEYKPERAKEILEKELKATKGSDGIYVLPDGTRLGPYKVLAVFGWTDWMTAVDLVAQSAKAAGIDVSTEYPEAPVTTSRRNNGDFDLIIWTFTGASPASPWARFRDALDDRGVPEIGKPAFWNFGRFHNAKVGALLDKAAAAPDEATQKQLYGELDTIFMENIPVIPLMYRPLEFYEYNETAWTGFPNSANPTAPPQQWSAGIKLLYVIKPK